MININIFLFTSVTSFNQHAQHGVKIFSTIHFHKISHVLCLKSLIALKSKTPFKKDSLDFQTIFIISLLLISHVESSKLLYCIDIASFKEK